MASLFTQSLLTTSSLLLLLTLTPTTTKAEAAATSTTCKSQNFTTNSNYANCTDLPKLNSTLQYTYNATNTSLSIAFIAPPPKPDGWVAWAINPTSTGMKGSQALIAMKSSSSGSLLVKTYRIASYNDVAESKLSFDVWDLSAESDGDGNFVIFASVKVNGSEINHVWQVGHSVTDGRPDTHDFASENLLAKATLKLLASTATNSSTVISNTATSSNNTITGTTNTTAVAHGTTINGSNYGFRLRGLSLMFGFVLGCSFLSLV